jgi:rhodanese-related sulfurtransferase
LKLPWWIPFGHVREIAPGELARWLGGEAPPQLLDVRSAGEYARGHLPGSVNVPILELRSRLGQLALAPDRPVVAICLSAHRSVPAVRLLERAGYRDVQQLAGGMLAWWRSQREPGS